MGNATNSGVHLTHLIGEIFNMTTKVRLHPLKLRHDGLEGQTTNYRGRRQNSRNCRIYHLHSWPLQLKLGFALLDRTSADGTYGGEERRERNGNVKVLKDPRDS